jgi:uncharacterized membrane protein YphA (DoxX/SURF4 family)
MKPTILLLSRVIVGSVLIYSGLSKAIAPSAEFAGALAAYHILPSDIIPLVASVWPWIELLVGTYLFFGYYTRQVATAACVLFGIFLVILISASLRGIDPGTCGCFGAGFSMSVRQMEIVDSALFIMSILATNLSNALCFLSADCWINK